MAAYRRVYDSRHLQADCQEPGSAQEPYARQSSMGYLYLFLQIDCWSRLWLFIKRVRQDSYPACENVAQKA